MAHCSKFKVQSLLIMGVFICCAFILNAQHPISVALDRFLKTGNCDDACNSISGYSNSELAALPDSVFFDYCYLKAVILDLNGIESEKEKQSYLKKAKNLCSKLYGIHSPVYLEICWALGNSYEKTGDTVSAFELYQAALIQSRGFYNLEDDDVRWQYNDIATKVLNWYQDDSLRYQMIKNRNRLAPRYSTNNAKVNDDEFYDEFSDESRMSIGIMADQLFNNGNWVDASHLYDSLAVTTINPVAKATLQELEAICQINMEDFGKAEQLLLSNIDLLTSHKNTKVYRRTLSLLSSLYSAIHNYTKAYTYALEAKFTYEEVLDFSKGYITTLHRFATLEQGNNNIWNAILLEDVAMQEIYKNTAFDQGGISTSREIFLANSLSSDAIFYHKIGFEEDAYHNLKSAIEIAKANNFDSSPYYHNLATLYASSKDFEKSWHAEKEAYALTRSCKNKIEIGIGLCLSEYFANQKISKDIIIESSDNLRNMINQIFAYTSVSERKNFWSYYEYYFPVLNFIAYQTGDSILYRKIYDNILIEKGLLLHTTNALHDQILNNGTNEDIQKYNHMLQLRMMMPSLGKEESIQFLSEIERLDKELQVKFSDFDNFKQSMNISYLDVQQQLDEEDIAIEFYNIPEVERDGPDNDIDLKYRYCALILRKNYTTPHILPLCTDDKLNSIDRETIYETDSIYNLIWKPLEQELKGVKNIYFAADRELHKIGIEYAPISKGCIIGDKYNLYRLSSTRVLAENKTKNKKESAVLYGGLKYDLDKDELIAESRSGDYHPTSTSRAFTAENSRYGVKYLPGTLKEVEEISKNFSSSPRLITDISGTEESFKSLAGSSTDIIHLATHGFFWNEDDAQKHDYVTFLNPSNRSSQSNEDKALMRSGLLFSGANIGLKGETLPDDVEDGVLTALELSNMNLGNVDMVVMSACESGLGESSGEGVFGLQRGFKLAGANTLLMSLWQVDDAVTPKLMTEFYRNYLSGKSKHESLRLAQKSLRDSSEYSDPDYWAAFILLDGIK